MTTEPMGFETNENGPMLDADLLEEIVLTLVDHPESVRIEEVSDEKKTTLRIHVHPEDNRHVIGRQGATIKIIRQLFAIVGGKQHRWTLIEVVDGAAFKRKPRA